MKWKDWKETLLLSQTLFSLPWTAGVALLALFDTGEGRFVELLRTLFFGMGALIIARCSGMAFNRYFDRSIDGCNPRTSERAIPRGALSAQEVLAFALLSLFLFFFFCYQISERFALLAILPGVAIVIYPWTKRYTSMCHFFLGFVQLLAPLYASLALRGGISLSSSLIASCVMLTITGSDVIYGCLDVEFDRGFGIHSLPARIGTQRSLRLARFLHLLALLLLLPIGWIEQLGSPYYAGIFLTAFFLFFSHRNVDETDPHSIVGCFQRCNTLTALFFFLSLLGGLVWRESFLG